MTKTATTFQKGDRVRVTTDFYVTAPEGSEGVVSHAHGNLVSVKVEGAPLAVYAFTDEQVELIAPAPVFQEGDRVRVKNVGSYLTLDVGAEGTVTSTEQVGGRLRVSVPGSALDYYLLSPVCLEPIAEPDGFQVGDRVVLTEEPPYLSGYIGREAIVASVLDTPAGLGADRFAYRVELAEDRQDGCLVTATGIEAAPEVEVIETAPEGEAPAFQVGDRVVTSTETTAHGVPKGSVGTVVSENFGLYRVEFDAGTPLADGYFSPTGTDPVSQAVSSDELEAAPPFAVGQQVVVTTPILSSYVADFTGLVGEVTEYDANLPYPVGVTFEDGATGTFHPAELTEAPAIPADPNTIASLQERAGTIAADKGFHTLGATLGDRLALVHSEVSEALEAYRESGSTTEAWEREDGKPEGVPSELADVVIRVLDLCYVEGIDLQEHVQSKLAYNAGRPHLHGGKKL